MHENPTENASYGEVRVHIDQSSYHSPNPTTGTALYELAKVHEGQELFREVTGDHEDEFIPKDGNEIRLTQDEHFHSAKDRKFRIIVNLEEKVVTKRVLTFSEVVKLAYPHVQDGPDVIYTVTYKKAAGPQREGTLDEGQSVEIKNGTNFHVRPLIARNADLKRLRDEGYFVSIKGSSLLVGEVPYVTETRQVERGVLVCPLDLAGDKTIRPGDHQVQFIGDRPCNKDGTPMTKLIGSEINNAIAPGLVARFSFSHKPACGFYADYYEKMTAYATMLAAQAAWLEPGADARANRVVEPEPDEESPFNYLDTASSRAGINGATTKLKLRKVVIAGLGGTGSYVLDPVAKTPTATIHLIDGDVLNTHNAFRSPGAPSIDELRAQPYKVDYFKAIYDKMRRGIVAHPEYLDESNAEKHLKDADFVFVCIDDGKAKAVIIRKLEEFGVPFVDVGMGLIEKNEQLGGILRVTTSTEQQRAARRRIPCSEADPENEYDRNIQIADLNMLNAALAVVKWKKLFGFYADNESEHFSTYTIDTNLLTSDET